MKKQLTYMTMKQLVHTIALACGLLTCFSLQAQFGFKTPLTELTEAAVSDAFYVAQIDYVLVDEEGNKLGRNNQPYFTRSYTVGLAVADAIWFPQDGYITPWKMDADFDAYRDDPTLQPALFKMAVAGLTADSFLRVKADGMDSLVDETQILFGDEIAEDVPSLELHPDAKGKVLAVFIYAKKKAEEYEPADFALDIRFQNGVILDAEKPSTLEELPTGRTLVGGGLFTVSHAFGSIQFTPWGVIMPKAKGGWQAVAIPATKEAGGGTLSKIIEERMDEQKEAEPTQRRDLTPMEEDDDEQVEEEASLEDAKEESEPAKPKKTRRNKKNKETEKTAEEN